ncbi:FaeA/PapI family transcriptional regulator [Serratia entomophila]|uniref:FaeA/PapI family transcriptional regulator n=1 Tax=Serratia entomophila TaxID=42906 RepID=UPI0021797979|nr:FaeA/PapI family transcriptional regulator [Serratia entomophila]CAI1116547.1 ABC-type uncharacterized transport system, permease component [Serratia entomophila]CAI1123008.1 ABC-type uncharacterized transport system, permease component [Serratia entomophila]CAI1126495.1 ABC-type uncharacterized transport system, permease component [Serratia entomophila]CAI1953424.1 ABC-type uncharacterized transport system, permease component [Serratia entomophila]CAI1962481.1 ABC-type uncharacterized tran
MAKEPGTYESRKLRMLNVLQVLCRERAEGAGGHHPPPEQWPKTRELADRCGENIYTTRTLLLALEKEGKVYCTHRSINNSLRWYICAERTSAGTES